MSCHKCYTTHSHIIGYYSVTSHDGSHDGYGKTVHRPYSSCISSIQNPIGTLLSSPCQLRPGGWLSYLG